VKRIYKCIPRRVIYDGPSSYCDTRYKIAGQWYRKLPLPRAVEYFEFRGCMKELF
jgi:hypothetical protein